VDHCAPGAEMKWERRPGCWEYAGRQQPWIEKSGGNFCRWPRLFTSCSTDDDDGGGDGDDDDDVGND